MTQVEEVIQGLSMFHFWSSHSVNIYSLDGRIYVSTNHLTICVPKDKYHSLEELNWEFNKEFNCWRHLTAKFPLDWLGKVD